MTSCNLATVLKPEIRRLLISLFALKYKFLSALKYVLTTNYDYVWSGQKSSGHLDLAQVAI